MCLSSKSDFAFTGGAATRAVGPERGEPSSVLSPRKHSHRCLSVVRATGQRGKMKKENTNGDEGAGGGLMWRRQRQAWPQTFCQLRPTYMLRLNMNEQLCSYAYMNMICFNTTMQSCFTVIRLNQKWNHSLETQFL